LLLAFLRSRLVRHTANHWFRRLDVLATNLAACLLIGELALRALGYLTGNPLVYNERLDGWRLAPNRNYGGLLTTNSLGYPSREFQREKRLGIRRIAALGDSFAVGVVPQEHNFLRLLEQRLNHTEVYNFGVTGIGPREYDSILRSEVWQFQPDMILLCLFVGNDITGWWRLPSAANLDPKAHQLYVMCHRAWRLAREWLRRRGESANAVEQPFEFPRLSRQTHLEHEVQRLGICRPSQAGSVQKSWNRTLTYLEHIETQCRAHRVPLAVVLIPDEVQVNADLLREVLEFGTVPELDLDLGLPQRKLTGYFAQRGLSCLDLMPAFAAVPDTYRPRDTHWNENGNHLAAEQIAAWLQTNFDTTDASTAATDRSASNSRHIE
jgi:hypothetical protein